VYQDRSTRPAITSAKIASPKIANVEIASLEVASARSMSRGFLMALRNVGSLDVVEHLLLSARGSEYESFISEAQGCK
jgi:hypothetical protein